MLIRKVSDAGNVAIEMNEDLTEVDEEGNVVIEMAKSHDEDEDVTRKRRILHYQKKCKTVYVQFCT